jgi:hypothetical protein
MGASLRPLSRRMPDSNVMDCFFTMPTDMKKPLLIFDEKGPVKDTQHTSHLCLSAGFST